MGSCVVPQEVLGTRAGDAARSLAGSGGQEVHCPCQPLAASSRGAWISLTSARRGSLVYRRAVTIEILAAPDSR